MKALAGDRRDRLRAMLADLKLPGALEAVDGILAQADSGAVTASEAIEDLLSAQIVLRNNRRLQTAMRSSRLPAVKTLQQFDFSFQPSIKRQQIDSLHELGFLKRAENVILLGPPGVGKTHLAISLAIAAAESGRRVYYGTLAALIESLTEAKAAGNLSRRLRVLTHPALLVVDEIGYLPVSQDGAVLFFQLINARHERASTVLTSNKGFEEWGGVLGDEIMAAALIDCWQRSESEPISDQKVSHLGRVRVYASLCSVGLLESVAVAAAVAVGNRSAGFPRRCGKRSAVFRGAGSFRSRPPLRSAPRRRRGGPVAGGGVRIHEGLLRSRVR